jgi:hypothetical protein
MHVMVEGWISVQRENDEALWMEKSPFFISENPTRF